MPPAIAPAEPPPRPSLLLLDTGDVAEVEVDFEEGTITGVGVGAGVGVGVGTPSAHERHCETVLHSWNTWPPHSFAVLAKANATLARTWPSLFEESACRDGPC